MAFGETFANSVIMLLRGMPLLVLWSLVAAPVRADRLSDTYNGRKVLADFMVGLAKHVTWPDEVFAGSRSDFVVCVLGPDPFEGSLGAKFGDRRVGLRDIAVRLLAQVPKEGFDGCHQLFIAAGLRAEVKEILERLDNLKVLSVSDMEGFASAGGMVGVVGTGNRVSMQINRTALLASGLTVSPALLRLGR